MPLPTGQWNAVLNGEPVTLAILFFDQASGQIRGTIAGLPYIGFWNEVAQRVTFCAFGVLFTGGISTINGDQALAGIRQFTGYLMQTPTNAQPGADLTLTLAGTFEAGQQAGGTSRRSCFGWYATIQQIV